MICEICSKEYTRKHKYPTCGTDSCTKSYKWRLFHPKKEKLPGTWRQRNREKVNEWQRQWVKNNPLAKKLSMKKWIAAQGSSYQYIKTKPTLLLAKKLRNRVCIASKQYNLKKRFLSSRDGLIDYKGIVIYLQSRLPNDLNDRKYHIDHIKPLCSFDLTKPEEVRKAFAPENHQWLLAEENRKKIKQDKQMSIRCR